MAGPLDDLIGTPQPTKPQPATTAGPLDDLVIGAQVPTSLPKPPTQSWAGGMLDQIKAGATLGLDKDIEAAVSNGGTHAQKREVIADRQKQFRDENPWMGNIGWYGGAIAGLTGLGPLLQAMGAPVRVVQAANAVSGVTNFNKAVAPGVTTGRALHEFGKAGLKGGAINTFGDAGGDATARAAAVADPGHVALSYGAGAALGPVATKAGEVIGKGLQRGVDMVRAAREGGDVINGGTREAARAMTRDGVPDAMVLREQILPTHKAMGVDDVEALIASYGRHSQRADMTPREVRAAMVDEMVANGVSKRTAQGRVRDVLDRFEQMNRVPLQAHELVAARTGGEASNTFGMYEFGARMPGEGTARSSAVDWAKQRQESQGSRLADLFQRYLGDGNVENAIKMHKSRIGASNDLYREPLEAFSKSPEAKAALQRAIGEAIGDMDRVFAGRSDVNAAKAMSALNGFRNRVVQQGDEVARVKLDPDTGGPQMMKTRHADGTEAWVPMETLSQNPSFKTDVPTDSLESFIGQRGVMRDAIDLAHRMGKGSLGNDLKTVRDAVTKRVEALADAGAAAGTPGSIFHQFWSAHRTRASAGALKDAWRVGMDIPVNPTTGAAADKYARAMMAYRGMTAEQQEMAKMGLMGQLKAKLDGAGDTRDVSKFFKNDNSRRLFGEMFGKNAAEVADQIERAAIATRTYGVTKKSPSAPLLEQSKQIRSLVELATNVTNPMYYLRQGGDLAARALERGRNEQAMKLLGTNTQSPAEMLAALRAIAAAQGDIQRSVSGNIAPVFRNFGSAAGAVNAGPFSLHMSGDSE